MDKPPKPVTPAHVIESNKAAEQYNSFVNRCFMGAAIVGIAVLSTKIPIMTALRSEDIRPYLDANNLTEAVRYIGNHVRNGGQALVYGQAANITIGTFQKELSERTARKANGYPELERIKDHSVKVGTGVFLGNLAFEATFGANSAISSFNLAAKTLDTHDILWVGLGGAAMVLWNKTSEMYARHKFPKSQPQASSAQVQVQALTPAPNTL